MALFTFDYSFRTWLCNTVMKLWNSIMLCCDDIAFLSLVMYAVYFNLLIVFFFCRYLFSYIFFECKFVCVVQISYGIHFSQQASSYVRLGKWCWDFNFKARFSWLCIKLFLLFLIFAVYRFKECYDTRSISTTPFILLRY